MAGLDRCLWTFWAVLIGRALLTRCWLAKTLDAANNVIREVNASSGDISTVAGNGTIGYSGDGGPATSAELSDPSGVAVDASGDLFIADSANNVVREVNASSGDISTVAGDGTPGYFGDGGTATSAELNDPSGLAVDSGGDLFIADSANNVIRRVVLGVIGTYAGNALISYSGDGASAIDAELDSPAGIATSSSGTYITDEFNNVVRFVSDSTGNIATMAGNGSSGYSGDGGLATSAELSDPTGVALSGSNVFIADSGNSGIRKINSSGDISTFAGTGTGGYGGDGGLATSAELNGPTAVAYDVNGNLWITDSGNNLVRFVSSGGSL